MAMCIGLPVKVLKSGKKLWSLLTFAFYDLSICEERFGRKLQLLKVSQNIMQLK